MRLLGGLLLWVTTLYCAAGRARTGKGRGREGSGVYPEFGVLGIQEGSSPALVREVGRQVALLPSYAISREELARRGLDLDIKEIYGIGKYAGAAALTYRRRLLEQYRAGLLPAGSEWAGKRLGVFVDGGRTKIRTTTRRQKGRGKHKTQRRRYRTDWREPKLLIIVELDERGRMVPGSKAVLDGTFEGPDELMELLAMYLASFWGGVGEVGVFGSGRSTVGMGPLGLGHPTCGLEGEPGDARPWTGAMRCITSVWPWSTWSRTKRCVAACSRNCGSG